MKHVKKLFSLLLSAAMLSTVLTVNVTIPLPMVIYGEGTNSAAPTVEPNAAPTPPAASTPTAMPIISGTCGENLTWTLDNGMLTISGTGDMDDNPQSWNYYRHTITSVVIENGVTSIGNQAFMDCSALTSISIPHSVTSIGNHAFKNCSALTSISIPHSVTSVGNYAFYHCPALTSISIPHSVTSIGNHAFENCSALTSISIPDSVTSIGVGVFFGCSALTNISIPDSLTSIGDAAFSRCSALTDVYYSGTQEQWNEIDKGSDNNAIYNATIHYNSTMPEETTPPASSTTAPTV